MIINCSERMVTLFLFSLVSFCEAAVAALGDSQETGGGCNIDMLVKTQEHVVHSNYLLLSQIATQTHLH